MGAEDSGTEVAGTEVGAEDSGTEVGAEASERMRGEELVWQFVHRRKPLR